MISNQINTIVIGIGNEILTDDGIGPKLCDYLKESIDNNSIIFKKLNVGGLEVLEFIQGYEKVIFIDAIKTVSGQIGDVYLFTPDDFKETLHLSNIHDTSFITALELGKHLDFKIPRNMYIIAVEIKEDLTFSEHFSDELAAKYPEIKKKVLIQFNELIHKNIIHNTNTFKCENL